MSETLDQPVGGRSSRRKIGYRPAPLLALAVALIALAPLSYIVVGPAGPAAAATRADGFQGGSGANSGHLGTVLADDGTLVLCVDANGLFPSGSTTEVGVVSSLPAFTSANNGGHGGAAAVSGATLAMMSYAYDHYINATIGNNVEAAALDLYYYSLRANFPGPVGSQTNLNYYAQRAGSSAAAVKAAEAAIAADANANWSNPIPSSAPKPRIVVDDTTLVGTVSVNVSPVSATGTLTLTGATQTGTGATSITVHNGDVININATPTPPPAAVGFTVTAQVVWNVPTSYGGQVIEYHTSSPRFAQLTVRSAPPTMGTIEADAELDDPLPNTFSPVVTTELPASFIDRGATMDDTLTADVAAGSGAWGQDIGGNYFPVVAKGTWYAAPTPSTTSATVPPGATVLGTETVTLHGPGTYNVTGPLAADPGPYTVVWTIDAADQGPLTQRFMPTDYSWSDGFEEATETGIVRSSIQAVTQTSVSSQGLDAPASDTVTPQLGAGTTTWPVDLSGNPVPVAFNGTEYWVPGDGGVTPAATAPATATAVATATVTATSTSDLSGPSETVPETTDGYFVWQWTTPQTDYVDAWTETFGDPTQVIQVSAPTVATTAGTPSANGTVSDTGTIGGGTPPDNSTVTFTAYQQPAGSATPECDATTLAYTSAQLPVTGIGDAHPYNSGNAQQPLGTTWFWVLTVNGPGDTVLAQGTCGAVDEISIAPFVINTTAAQASLDGTVSDTLQVDGLAPAGATVTFAAYSVTPNGTSPVCAGTPAFTSAAVPLDGSGDYKSGDALKPTPQQWDWVATVTASDGTTVLGQGVCGDAKEISFDSPAKVLGLTGDVMNYTALFSAVLAILIGGVAMVRGNRRRRREGRDAAS